MGTASNLISILIAEDHEIMGYALERALQDTPGFSVVGRVTDGLQALRFVVTNNPCVAVLDVSMPGLNGVDCARRINEEAPGTSVIGLSMHLKQEFVLGMLQAGAKGYVVKSSDFSELITCIQHAAEGRAYFCSQVTAMVLELLRSKADLQSGRTNDAL